MTLTTWLLLAGVISCMAVGAFFSGAESGFTLADPLKLQHRAERGDTRSKQVLKMKQSGETLIGALLIGNNIMTVSATVLCNKLLEYWFSPKTASVLSVFVLTVLMLVTSEIIPKMIFLSRPEDLTRKVAPILRVLTLIFRPVLLVINGLSKLFVGAAGGGKKKKKARPSLTRDDISLLAEIGKRDGVINPHSYILFSSVLAFWNTTAREIMTPLVDLTAIEEDASVEDLVRVIMRSGFSRIPVYKEHVFTMVGYVSAFDLKKSRRNEGISEYIRRASFVPESKNIESLLIEMRQERLPLVFVVDEWGGTAGIVTHEDIAEHVVGQIKDKGEKTELEMRQIAPGEYLADGWTDIDKVRQTLHIRIDKKGFETAGGFLEHLMQRIPLAGESISYEGCQFFIEEADPTRIIRVRIQQKSGKKNQQERKKPALTQNGKKNGTTNTQ